MPMMALVNPVYDCLFRLAQPDSLRREEEVGAGKRRMAADAPLVLRGTSKKARGGESCLPGACGGNPPAGGAQPRRKQDGGAGCCSWPHPLPRGSFVTGDPAAWCPSGQLARCHARSPPSHEGTAAVEPPVSADPRCLSSGAGRRALGQQLPGSAAGRWLRGAAPCPRGSRCWGGSV